jgi:hypothetical protein
MIRPTTLEAIRAQLSYPPYVLPDDFSIEYEAGTWSTKVALKLVTGDASFVATIPKKKAARERAQDDFQISCAMNPGEITNRQEAEVWGLDNLKIEINAWAQRIAEDFARAPAMRVIAKEAQRIKDLEEKLAELPDEATPDQIAKMEAWLNDIEAQLKAKIEQLEINDKQKQQQLDKLAVEFAFMKERLEGTTFKNAVRAIASRLQRIAADPQTGNLLENGSKVLQMAGNVVDLIK